MGRNERRKRFFYINFETRKIENYLISNNKKAGSNCNNINVIYQDNPNQIWLGTYGGGLFIYNLKTKTAKNISQSDGLLSNYINVIRQDKNGMIRITSPDGVNVINPKDFAIRQVPVSLSYNDNDYCNNFTVANDGNFYFTSLNSLHQVDPEYLKSKQKKQSILLSSCQVLDIEKFYEIKNKTIHLTYNQNFIDFTYSLSKENPSELVNYAYKLDGLDRNWNYTNQTKVSYKDVPPGKYSFIIKATNEVGEWQNAEKLVNVVITPPFWQTWWFYILSFLLVIFSIYLVIQYRVQQFKKVLVLQNNLHQMQQKISSDLHDNIGASLSSINMLSEVIKQKTKNSQVNVTSIVDKISETSTEVITEMKDTIWFINPEHQSFDFLVERIKQYAEPLSAEMDINFLLHYNSNKKFDEMSLFSKKNIYLIIKEAVNNSLKYAKASTICIEFLIVKNEIKISVKDDGIGFSESQILGNGINNMKTRAKDLDGSIEINIEKGTTINLILKT